MRNLGTFTANLSQSVMIDVSSRWKECWFLFFSVSSSLSFCVCGRHYYTLNLKRMRLWHLELKLELMSLCRIIQSFLHWLLELLAGEKSREGRELNDLLMSQENKNCMRQQAICQYEQTWGCWEANPLNRLKYSAVTCRTMRLAV